MSLASKLQRAHLAQLTPYASARRSMSGGNVWLNANEAPSTPLAAVADNAMSGNDLNRYPSFQSAALNQAYASYAEVSAEQVLSCRGSDEAIELLIRTFCEPGRDSIVICPPTYGMYAISAQTHGAGVISVPLQQQQLDVPAILEQVQTAAQTVKLIFVCNPSNPLGNNLALDSLQQLLQQVGERAIVVVDEAYIEFAAASSVQALNEVSSWLQQYPQLVVLRTLSKAFGLAGIRCGFALAPADIIEALRKVIAPYPLPQTTVTVATQALSDAAINAMQQQVAATNTQRERLLAALADASWVTKIWPSCTNFVLLTVTDAAAIVAHFAAAGILIRNQSQQLGLANSVRISIGSAAEMDQLLKVFP
ncbi:MULTISPECIES: histidinol-phosphate transaminase [Pseudidiomarina]|uniref:Histidinol-phosphate aminotransferase n=2 Tax=Pseudidiomarina TaxID=2800384 RepID=A0A368V4I2_9GAMM|nr:MULTISPECIES: histidinol-phosphate transaminase [Pseudidiomarina]PWW15951.1 histidinol-phosphate aminotransferase [Pseudidiomarina maritima]RBP93539.1 histidinol-phosphate aminotransferase [Pseudidiomarina tainanensis]RCW35999.1 histidinol-phosphate aminotransferase [Pseudidiomarina tainanensis]